MVKKTTKTTPPIVVSKDVNKTTNTTAPSVKATSKKSSKLCTIYKTLRNLLFLLFGAYIVYIQTKCPLNPSNDSLVDYQDDKICEITHMSFDDYLKPSYDNYLKPAYFNYVVPTYENHVVPTYHKTMDNYITPNFNKFVKPQYQKLVNSKQVTDLHKKCQPALKKIDDFYCVFTDKCQDLHSYYNKVADYSMTHLAKCMIFIKENYACLSDFKLYVEVTKTYVFQYSIDLINKIISKFNEFLEAFQKDKISSKLNYKNLEAKLDFLKNEVYKKYLNGDSESILASTTTTTNTEKKLTATEDSKTSLPTNEKFQLILNRVTESAMDDFHKQINEIQDRYLDYIKESLLVEIKEFSQFTQSGYEEIHSLIYSISQNEPVGSEKYVTRQMFREKLAELTETLTKKSDFFANELRRLPTDYTSEITKLRENTLETLEEFSESTLAEYSKELTAKSTSNPESWNDWKQFKATKQKILQTRDDIVQLDTKPIKIQKKIQELDSVLGVLINDIGSYLSILRARANLAFQAREKLEKEERLEREEEARRQAAMKADSEIAEEGEYEGDYEDAEEEPITSTITRTVRITSTAMATAEPEPVVPEDVDEAEPVAEAEPESIPEVVVADTEPEQSIDDEDDVPELVEDTGSESESEDDESVMTESEADNEDEIEFQDPQQIVIEEPITEPLKVIVNEQEQMILDSINEEHHN